MSYYAEHNGLANSWERNDMRYKLAKWVFYHPEQFEYFVNKLLEYGIDLLEQNSDAENHEYNIQIFVDQLDQLSEEDIDDITGVNLDG